MCTDEMPFMATQGGKLKPSDVLSQSVVTEVGIPNHDKA